MRNYEYNIILIGNMITSRQRLLHYVEKKQVATVKDISLTLKMTPANARHHLSILVDQGSVEIFGKLIAQGRGRPNILYRAVKPSSKNNLIDLSRIILRELLEGKNDREKNCLLKILAKKMVKEEVPESYQQYKRLNDTIHRLNQMNYKARWEAHHEAPHIILEECPYIEIIGDFPEICRMDKYIIEILIGNQVYQISKLESIKSGFHRCVFSINSD